MNDLLQFFDFALVSSLVINHAWYEYHQDFAHSKTAFQCYYNNYFENLLFRRFMQDSLLINCGYNCLKKNSFSDFYYGTYYYNVHFIDLLFFLFDFLIFISWNFLLNFTLSHSNLIHAHINYHWMNFLPRLH